jgi:hypothetical protein
MRPDQVFQLLQTGECPVLEDVLGHIDPLEQRE